MTGRRRRRSAGPCPALRSACSRRRLPYASFFRTNTGIEGEMMPAIGPTAPCSWQGENLIAPEAASRCGLLPGVRALRS